MTHFRLSCRGHSVDGEQWIFTLHVSQAVVIASDILPVWDTAVNDFWGTTTGPTGGAGQYYPDTYGIDQLIVDELDPVTGKNVRQAQEGLGLVGRGTDEPLPPQNAVVVSLRTDLPTRAGRGRFYLPGPDVTTLSGGRLNNGARTALANAAADLIGDLNDSGAVTEVYHRVTKTGTAVVRFDIGDVFDTQRRRRDKLVETRTSRTL
jgi:hypothetical protein